MYSNVQYGKLAFLLLRTRSIPHQQGKVKPPKKGVFFYLSPSLQNWSKLILNISHSFSRVCSFMFSCLRHWNTLWRLTPIMVDSWLLLMLFNSWATLRHLPAFVIFKSYVILVMQGSPYLALLWFPPESTCAVGGFFTSEGDVIVQFFNWHSSYSRCSSSAISVKHLHITKNWRLILRFPFFFG